MAQTSALTYAPMPREDYPAGHPLRTLSRLQPDELSPKVVGSVDRQNLVAALGAYAAQKHPPPPREGDPGLHNLLHAPWREPRVLSAPATPQKWPLSPGDPKHPLGRGDGKSASPTLFSVLVVGLFLSFCHLPVRPSMCFSPLSVFSDTSAFLLRGQRQSKAQCEGVNLWQSHFPLVLVEEKVVVFMPKVNLSLGCRGCQCLNIFPAMSQFCDFIDEGDRLGNKAKSGPQILLIA